MHISIKFSDLDYEYTPCQEMMSGAWCQWLPNGSETVSGNHSYKIFRQFTQRSLQ